MSPIPGLTANLDTKQCTFCQERKPHAEFRRRTRSKDGYTTRCKQCLGSKLNKHRQRQIEALRTEHAQCSKCGEVKHIKDMGLDSRNNITRLSSQCKACRAAASRESYKRRKRLAQEAWDRGFNVYCQSDANSLFHPHWRKVQEIVDLQAQTQNDCQPLPTQNSELATTTPLNTTS